VTGNPPTGEGLNYRDAGVDIDAGASLVERIGDPVAATQRPGMLSGLGGFGGLFELPGHYRRPVLVSGADGVGTKLRLAIDSGQHEGIGIDLVAMCVNDILAAGAEPLFFLDYYATGQLDVAVAEQVIAGIAAGCQEAGAGLMGGETAEMPGHYQGGDYDLAGFCVGAVEKDELIDGASVGVGDSLIGLGASGPHANGYSLIRRVIDYAGADWQTDVGDGPLMDALLTPTRIYVRPVLRLLEAVEIRAISHVTGGGLTENLPRVLPESLAAHVDTTTWQRPAVFDWLQSAGRIADGEMYRTFNNGVGMVLVVPEAQTETALARLRRAGETAWRLGEVVHAPGDGQRVVYA